MARITVEDCLLKENNRFALVLLAAKRAKQILQGGKVLSAEAKGNKAVVSSLREIAEGQVCFMTAEEVAAAKEQEEREAELKAKEAFEKLSQPVAESNGSAIADMLRSSKLADDDSEDADEVETAAEDDGESEAADAEEDIAGDDSDDSDDDSDTEEPDTEAKE